MKLEQDFIAVLTGGARSLTRLCPLHIPLPPVSLWLFPHIFPTHSTVPPSLSEVKIRVTFSRPLCLLPPITVCNFFWGQGASAVLAPALHPFPLGTQRNQHPSL